MPLLTWEVKVHIIGDTWEAFTVKSRSYEELSDDIYAEFGYVYFEARQV